MRRGAFLAAALAAPAFFAARSSALAQDEYDPASAARVPSLRVLLGSGAAAPNPGGGFTFNGRAYRGTFSPSPEGAIVNTIGLEEYLYSVVPREMPQSWPSQALQAQAVCARTYVLQRSNPRRAYDLVPSELDQVYEGVAAETATGRAAVDATAGRVVHFGSGYAEVMYSSCCGGRTEDSSDVWGGAPFPYLAGVACAYCADSPNFRWQRTIDRIAVGSAFAQELEPYGALTAVRAGERDASGRVRTVELVGARGSAFVKGSAFRSRIGSRILPSLLITRIDATPGDPERLAVEGGGLGHGVGLCQWGARGYALAGGSARDILGLYFPGTIVA